jgi:Na+-transporting NADH:ubiquinone oxidoreductase subunit C
MAEGGIRSIRLALILCVVCGGLLAGASSGLKPFQEVNRDLDIQKNILKAAGIVDEEEIISKQEIREKFKKRITYIKTDKEGKIVDNADKKEICLPLYIDREEGIIKAFIIPINTKGLWGEIKGYLALKPDGTTISGFTVFKHSETPGLGGEIEKKWFQKQFVGKKIRDEAGNFIGINIAKGKIEGQIPRSDMANYVDGISGATLTGKFLTSGLKRQLADYEPVSVRFRQGEYK